MLRKYSLLIALVILFSANICLAENLLTVPEPPPINTTLPTYMTWAFNAGMGIGFFSIIIALTVSGVLFTLSASSNMRSRAKEWLSGAITGFLIFTLLYLIITTIYPPLADFGIGAPLVIPTLTNDAENPGVFFYGGSGCSGTPFQTTSNIPNFSGAVKQTVGSVKIVPDKKNGINYIAVVYNNKNYYGQCAYINPQSQSCNNITLDKTLSASVYKYSSSGSGTVVFYRNGAFNKKGGYLELSSQDIGKLYQGSLSKLTFTGDDVGSTDIEDCTVPNDQQDCVLYDDKGVCQKRQCPKLSDGNISSIEVKGDYLVMITFQSPTDTGGSWTYCQAYPKDQDVNKIGPKQIKWDAISNAKNVFPNYLVIIPIKNN